MSLIKRVTKFVLLTLAIFITAMGVATKVTQAKSSVNQFQVKPILPADNAAKSSYFDLKVKPSQSQVLKIRIFNNSTKRQQFYVKPSNATTSSTGAIAYTGSSKKDASAATAFSDMISDKTGKPVTIDGQSSATVSFKLNVSKQQFTGTVLGGFVVHSVSASDHAAQNSGVNNLARYVVAVRLKESSTTVKPNLLYHGTHYAGMNGLPAIQVKLQNNQPVIIGNVHLKATVTGEGNKTVAKVDNQLLNFAPTSRFNYTISTLNGQQLKTGQYRLLMTVKGDNGYWKFDKLFTVTNSDTASAHVAKRPFDWWQLLQWVIEGLAALIVLAYLVKKVRDWWHKDDDSKS